MEEKDVGARNDSAEENGRKSGTTGDSPAKMILAIAAFAAIIGIASLIIGWQISEGGNPYTSGDVARALFEAAPWQAVGGEALKIAAIALIAHFVTEALRRRG